MSQTECKLVWHARRAEKLGEQVLTRTGKDGLWKRMNKSLGILARKLESAVGGPRGRFLLHRA